MPCPTLLAKFPREYLSMCIRILSLLSLLTYRDLLLRHATRINVPHYSAMCELFADKKNFQCQVSEMTPIPEVNNQIKYFAEFVERMYGSKILYNTKTSTLPNTWMYKKAFRDMAPAFNFSPDQTNQYGVEVKQFGEKDLENISNLFRFFSKPKPIL